MKYKYKVFPLLQTLEFLTAKTEIERDKEGFVSEDVFSTSLQSTLAEGFRWVGTEAEMAVFEKELSDDYSLFLEEDL
jgi:hypothetical protein